jgi:hypothetical protein
MVAAHGVGTAIDTIEEQVPGMSTRQVEDKLTENMQTLAREMAQSAQRSEQLPAEIIAAALATGYLRAELRHRKQ